FWTPLPDTALAAVQGSHLLADNPEPERRVGGVAIRRVLAVNRVRQRSVLLESRERLKDLLHVLRHSRGQQSARADQRVAPPIEKPGITGDDRFSFAAPHDECLCRLQQSGTESLLPDRDARRLSAGNLQLQTGTLPFSGDHQR